MRILVAPDKFAGTLTAVQAAEAIARGWLRRCPHDVITCRPMSDGGPGFVDVLHEVLGGELSVGTVTGPLGESTPVTLLLAHGTAYVESAQAVGLHLVAPEDRDPERTSSRGVGEAVLAAVAAGARRIVVGLGGTASNDGGAGMLAALGATADCDLSRGPQGLSGVTEVDLDPAVRRLAGVELIAATDVEATLTGLFGATKQFGPQKGIAEERLPVVDGWLQVWAAATDRKLATEKGAGAAGGLGFALMLLGATQVSGLDLVAESVGLAEQIAECDVVVTGEGAFDFSSRSGKVPYGVAARAVAGLRPCVVLAGQVLVGAREMRALGIESAYSISELVGVEQSMTAPADSLAALAERVARTWGGRTGV